MRGLPRPASCSREPDSAARRPGTAHNADQHIDPGILINGPGRQIVPGHLFAVGEEQQVGMEPTVAIKQPNLEIGMICDRRPQGVGDRRCRHLDGIEIARVLAQHLWQSDGRHVSYRRTSAARRLRNLGPARHRAQPRTPPSAPKTMWLPRARMNP